MLHRAVLGSIERFIGIYIEHTGGDFPFWLAPVQFSVLPIGENQRAYAEKVTRALQGAGVRADLDGRSETLGFKIREAEQQKIPLSLVIGEQEEAAGTVAPRLRRSKKPLEAISMDDMVARLAVSAAERKMGPLS